MTIQRTALFEQHLERKAKMVNFAGWEMPVQYSSVKEEVLAVRQSVGVFDVSHMGEFIITGPEASQFVDTLVTNDIQNAPVGKAIYSPLCRENGTVIDDLIVYKLKTDFILICVNASNCLKDFDWISSKKGAFNIQLKNASDRYSLLAVQGPQSEEILKTIFPQLPQLKYYAVSEMGSLIVARTGYTGEDGFEIFCSHQEAKKLWNELMERNVKPCGLAARDVLRLEVGYPLYGHELNDSLTPYDANLGWTVKKTKKFFIGMEALQSSPAQNKLVRFICQGGIPREGYKIFNQNQIEVGQVVSGTLSVTLNQGIAQALITKKLFQENDQFFVEIRSQKHPLKLIHTPFVNGGIKK